MKKRAISTVVFLLYSIICSAEELQENCIQGSVDLEPGISQVLKENNNSALFIYIRELGRESGVPSAVITIDNPVYPQDFMLCGEDQMLRGRKARALEEIYKVFARHSPTGIPMKKEGVIGDSLGADGKGVRAGEQVRVIIDRQYGK